MILSQAGLGSRGLLIPAGRCWVAVWARDRRIRGAVLCPGHGPGEPQPLQLSRRLHREHRRGCFTRPCQSPAALGSGVGGT